MVEQLEKRGNGTIPTIKIDADNLAEATYKAIISCYEQGARVETPKHREGMTLGYDADMIITVKNPDAEPKVFLPGVHDDARGVMQYILEVTHGIHNHWKKNEQHPEWWGYTYNERVRPQIPFVLERIAEDWTKRGRISGRDYQFTTWIAGEDIVPEQDDPPCWQSGRLRFLHNNDGELVMNYQTEWRSRDLLKAWNENNIAQIELMKRLKDKVSQKIGEEIKLGSYIDRSSSLHLYGFYFDRDGLGEQIKVMQERGVESLSMPLQDYFQIMGEEAGNPEQLKALIHAQSLAERDGHGLNQSRRRLEELGYSTNNYPQEWNSWDPIWDEKPDKSKLARVIQ